MSANEAALNADGLTLLSPVDEGTALLRRAKAGDRVAFEEIVRQHERQVFRVALRLLGSVEDAQDASQETLLRLHRHLGTMDELQSCGAWLYRVTVNIANDMLRKRRKIVPLVEMPCRAETEGAVSLEERRDLVNRALLDLPEKERAAIVLRDIEGLSTREVAAILNSSEATVRSQISTGRVKLKKLVDELMRGKQMNCADWEERIALYSSGDLVSVEIERHVASCSGCRLFLEELEANGTALAMLREQPLIRREKPARIPRWLPYAAAIALAFGAGALWKPETVVPLPTVRTAVDAPRLAPMPRPVVRKVRRVKKPEPHEPIVVKMLTSDPDVIIYWVTD